VKTHGADSSGVEGIPLIPACAEPFVLFAGRPAAQRATDARFGRIVIHLKLALQHGRVKVSNHAESYPDRSLAVPLRLAGQY
jgi:hypothetical protein